jgi:dihydrofolate reductase
MGRKTYESIGHALPGRANIVITRDETFSTPDGCFIVHSLDEALTLGKGKEQEELFIIGGANIYAQAIDIADKLYITEVHQIFPEADTFFPDYTKFSNVLSTKDGSGNGYTYTFFELDHHS